KRLDVEQRVRDLALLVVELDVAAELRRRQERRDGDAALQVEQRHLLALQLRERRLREAGAREAAPRELEGELAVDLELGHRADRLDHPLVRDAVARLAHALLERLARDHPLDHVATQDAPHVVAELGTVELREAVLLVLQLALELEEGDLLAVHLRRVSGAGQRGIDPPEHERDREQAEDDAGHPLPDGVMNLLQYDLSLPKRTPALRGAALPGRPGPRPAGRP